MTPKTDSVAALQHGNVSTQRSVRIICSIVWDGACVELWQCGRSLSVVLPIPNAILPVAAHHVLLAAAGNRSQILSAAMQTFASG